VVSAQTFRPETLRPCKGFTLIELLVVITIIAILSGLLFSSVTAVRNMAKRNETGRRMEAVLTAVEMYRQVCNDDIGAMMSRLEIGPDLQFLPVADLRVLHPAGIPDWVQPAGTIGDNANKKRRWGQSTLDAKPTLTTPQSVDLWPVAWPAFTTATAATTVPMLRFPWSSPGLRLDGGPCDPSKDPSTSMTRATTFADEIGAGFTSNDVVYNRWVAGAGTETVATAADQAPFVRSDGTTVNLPTNGPLGFDLGYMSPSRCIQILDAVGFLSASTATAANVRTDRNPNAAWNDTWGNPLFVDAAGFTPERFGSSTDGLNRRDRLLRGAQSAYGFNRAIYLAVGSTGDIGRSTYVKTWTDANQDQAQFAARWDQIREVTEAHTWTEASFANTPWSGFRHKSKSVNGVKEMCLITAPIAIK
jgi:prepilin-type N-terminal cleavage/methylation domain-containing protein